MAMIYGRLRIYGIICDFAFASELSPELIVVNSVHCLSPFCTRPALFGLVICNFKDCIIEFRQTMSDREVCNISVF